MKKIINLNHARTKLLDGEVLVYKPNKQPVMYLVLKDENRITTFSENVRYNISFHESGEILENNNVYIFEKDNDLEINQEFKKLIQ